MLELLCTPIASLIGLIVCIIFAFIYQRRRKESWGWAWLLIVIGGAIPLINIIIAVLLIIPACRSYEL